MNDAPGTAAIKSGMSWVEIDRAPGYPTVSAATAGRNEDARQDAAFVTQIHITFLGMVIGPNADRRVIAAANVALQSCGSVVLIVAAGHSIPRLLLGCLLFGLGPGNVASLPPLIAQTEFAPADLPRVAALVTAISQASYAFAPAVFGALRDLGQRIGPSSHAGNAPSLFGAAALIQIAAAGAAMLGHRRAAPYPSSVVACAAIGTMESQSRRFTARPTD
jgi:MFS family permease